MFEKNRKKLERIEKGGQGGRDIMGRVDIGWEGSERLRRIEKGWRK